MPSTSSLIAVRRDVRSVLAFMALWHHYKRPRETLSDTVRPQLEDAE